MICLKIRTFVVSATTSQYYTYTSSWLWFAWKFVPLWYQQQQSYSRCNYNIGCDLLENSYLCGISNNWITHDTCRYIVVICLKIRTFVVSATTCATHVIFINWLWFAWKFVPLWYQQQPISVVGTSNLVVICLKIRTFVVSATTLKQLILTIMCCDLLENSYLCGISNNWGKKFKHTGLVVICLKIRTFVVSATTLQLRRVFQLLVVICLKIRTFVVSATTFV